MNDGNVSANMRDIANRVSTAWPEKERPEEVTKAIDVLRHIDLPHEEYNGQSGNGALMTCIEKSRDWLAPEADDLLKTLAKIIGLPQEALDRIRASENGDTEEVEEEVN